MFVQLKETLQTGGRIDRAQAEWLFTACPDEELRELAQLVRGRYHAPTAASWLKMAIVNYTNVCVARCDYCAFYRFPGQPDTYTLSFEQVRAKIDALVALGGDMVGFNGGFHPDLSLEHYTELFAKCRAAFPELAFYEMTIAEFMFVAKRGKWSYADAAKAFADSGTRWITGGGSEVLDDAFRLRHSPGKYKVEDYYDAQRAVLNAGMGSTATMVIGFDESLEERLNHIERLRSFQDQEDGRLTSFLCWTYKPYETELGGAEVSLNEYLRWMATCRIYLDNIRHFRTSVLTRNNEAMMGLVYGADDFDLPTEDEVTQSAGATISHDFEGVLNSARELGFDPQHRPPFPAWTDAQ